MFAYWIVQSNHTNLNKKKAMQMSFLLIQKLLNNCRRKKMNSDLVKKQMAEPM